MTSCYYIINSRSNLQHSLLVVNVVHLAVEGGEKLQILLRLFLPEEILVVAGPREVLDQSAFSKIIVQKERTSSPAFPGNGPNA